MLNILDIAHTYQGTVEALSPVTFQVNRGEIISIVGPSGCGKSTLLRIIAGLLAPTQGTVMLDTTPVKSPHREIGLIFQNPTLMPWRTAVDNVALPLELSSVEPAERRQKAADMLKQLGLAGFEQSYPAALSGGMAQRVAIGRALIQNPEVLLLDEPFAALDALTREQMLLDVLAICARDHKTVIKVTHSITDAAFMADRVIVMSRRPGSIRAIIPIDLPRPRDLNIIHSPIFGVYARQIRENIETAN
jgi:NitT/TauT family transport system ATP-binding protein